MHGIVFLELRKYAVGKFGSEVWRELVRKAGLSSVFYEASRAYFYCVCALACVPVRFPYI